MAHQINWSTTVQISDGPQVDASKSLSIQAYDVIADSVPAKNGGPGELTVDVQPADEITFFSLVADGYPEGLTYSVKDGVQNVPFDAPVVLLGAAIEKLLDHTPQEITFTNDSAKVVKVELLIGR